AQNNSLFRAHRLKEFHRANSRKQEARLRVLRIGGGSGDAGGLRERFGQDHSRNERVSGKVTGKHRIVSGKDHGALRGDAGIARDNFTNKNKWRPMRKAEDMTRFRSASLLVT